MKKLMILGAAYTQTPLYQAAKRLGLNWRMSARMSISRIRRRSRKRPGHFMRTGSRPAGSIWECARSGRP